MKTGSAKKFTRLTLNGNSRDIETIVEGEIQEEPRYYNKCGRVINLYEAVPNYKGNASLYGCHCP